MANSPIVEIKITFRDRDANRGQMIFSTPWSLAISDIWLLAIELATKAAAISDAPLYKIQLLYRWRPDVPPVAPAGSNVARKLLVLITNEESDINALTIPSTRNVFETSGNYAGIRADLEHPAMVLLAQLLAELPFQTDDDRELGTTIAAAGLAL